MKNFYKVTSVQRKKTQKGDTVYSIQLNNSILIDYVYPDKIWRSSGSKNIHISSKLHDFWNENANSLEKLVGNYIVTSLSDSDFGLKFSMINSLDIISDFKKLLDKYQEKTFLTNLPIYDFLKFLKYEINNDGSISLKKEYEHLNIINIGENIGYGYGVAPSYTICYQQNLNDILIDDFKKELEESDEDAFLTNLPIYDFLKFLGYKLNSDKSITLQKPYDFFNIIKKDNSTICYKNKLNDNYLTLNNIEIIYDKFYHKKEGHTSETRYCSYKMKPIGIIEYCEKYSKHMGKRQGSSERFVLKIGSKLHQEQIDFLLSFK